MVGTGDVELGGKVVVTGVGALDEDEFLLNLLNEQVSVLQMQCCMIVVSECFYLLFFFYLANFSLPLYILSFHFTSNSNSKFGNPSSSAPQIS